MASPEVYDAIRAFLEANWTTSPLHFDNEHFDPDEGGPWVNVDIAGTLYAQETIGASVQADNRWDEEGQLFLDVSVKSGTGGSTARTHAKSLAVLFRGLTLLSGGLEFLEARVGPGGGDESGNWWTLSVIIEWRWMDAS